MTLHEQFLVKSIEKKLSNAVSRLKTKRANQQIKCCCGKYHAVKNCALIVTHWYVKPYSCSGGDYWVSGEWNFIGPCGVRNRLLFDDYGVEYNKRDEIGIAAEPTFKYNYPAELWRSIENEYGDKSDTNNINKYVDNHRKRFGLPERASP